MSVYDHKLMVWNEGDLPENLTIESLKQKHSSYPRNPILADIFFKGGLIEACGRGIIKSMEECKKAGLPEPYIEKMSGGICVTFFKDIYKDEYIKKFELNERQENALLFWKDNGEISTGKYMEKYKITDRTALRDIRDLEQKGFLKRIGKRRSTKYLFIK